MKLSYKNEIKALFQQHHSLTVRDLPEGKPIWIFGAGNFGRDLCSALQKVGHQVAGFVETNSISSQVMGYPVIGWDQWGYAHSNSPLCVAIFNRGMPLDELEVLARKSGAQDIFMPWDLYRLLKPQMGWRFWLSEPTHILEQIDAFNAAVELMDDVISQRCMLDIAAFRLGLKNSYGSYHHSENQYFNPLTLSSLQGHPIRFVDGGAYNGDTYLELCGVAEVEIGHLFEPDMSNFAQLTKNVKHSGRKAQCLPLGLADTYKILSFNSGSGEGASISETGSDHISVVALDDVLAGQSVDFIKLDVEGAELKALQGARNLIQRCRPVLALSLYHNPQDLWGLPLTLSELCEDYRFHVRQHYFNTFDSVLYAVPKDRQ